MAAEQNPFAKIPAGLNTTAAAAAFIETITYAAIPSDAVRIGTRCLLDGLGLFVAGAEEHSVEIITDEAEHTGGRPDAF
ncbi:MAG TPA: MmgE/PrpD family protein, partial [Candidatus Binatia bacterium]|nr:MmgE/PrpD family protein [Candidatus Binatia bacterium]